MGVLRSILHIATLGIIDSNKEAERKRTPFEFPPNMSEYDFTKIAISVAKQIKRLQVSVDNQFVRGTVRTSSGINTWDFSIDFNDFGTLTGKYWMGYVENTDSQIPSSYAKQLSAAIIEFLSNNQ